MSKGIVVRPCLSTRLGILQETVEVIVAEVMGESKEWTDQSLSSLQRKADDISRWELSPQTGLSEYIQRRLGIMGPQLLRTVI